jgi:methionyl-tRNA formyltransferase
LTHPYPCAFTFFNGRKVLLLSSSLCDFQFYGEPGRVYRKSKENGLLTCASDKCFWIKDSVYEDDGSMMYPTVNRYSKFLTVKDTILDSLLHKIRNK